MDVRRIDQATAFQPPGHQGVGPVYLQGGADYVGAVTVALSHYLPGGQADLSPVALETIYVLLSGSLEVSCEGEQITLNPYDSIRLAQGTVRSVENRTNLTASMLVIRPSASPS
jgi:mannose-6-phosphate isomerase-like protein (cupin superfamily)